MNKIVTARERYLWQGVAVGKLLWPPLAILQLAVLCMSWATIW